MSRINEYCTYNFAVKIVGERYIISALYKIDSSVHDKVEDIVDLIDESEIIFLTDLDVWHEKYESTHPTTRDRIKVLRNGSNSTLIRLFKSKSFNS